MEEYKKPSELRIYTPAAPQSGSVSVPHINLSKFEASLHGWHYRRKSGNRLRITRYTGVETTVTVPAKIDGMTVNEIGAQILSQNQTVSEVFVPDTIKKMMPGCFQENKPPKLKRIVFADGLLALPDYAFARCAQLSTVHLPKTLNIIGKHAFDSCKALHFLDIPVMCIQIGEYAFCSSGLREFRINQYMSPYLRISQGKPVFSIDGTAFLYSELDYSCDIIALPSQQPHCLDILNVCANVGLKLPNVNVRFCDRSIQDYTKLDMTDCMSVRLSRASFKDQDKKYCSSCTLLFSPASLCDRIDMPSYVDSNYYGKKLYHLWQCPETKVIVPLECAVVNEYAVNDTGLQEICFHRIQAYTEQPTMVFYRSCISLKTVTWEEDGQTFRKRIPGYGIVSDWVHEELLKAFIVKNDPDTGKSTFFDRSAVDKLFRNIPDGSCHPDGRFRNRLHKTERFAIAVDVLRSTQKPEEESLELYYSFLRTNRRIAEYISKKLPAEYGEYLRSYYQTHP